MTQPRQGAGGPDGRPRCYNGEPMRWYQSVQGIIPWAFSRECKSWASDPSTDPVPMAEGWRCEGCEHYPHELVKIAEARRAGRKA